MCDKRESKREKRRGCLLKSMVSSRRKEGYKIKKLSSIFFFFFFFFLQTIELLEQQEQTILTELFLTYIIPLLREDFDGWPKESIRKGREKGKRVFVSGLKQDMLLMK